MADKAKKNEQQQKRRAGYSEEKKRDVNEKNRRVWQILEI